MTARVVQGDCLALLKTLADNSIDSIVTDPPYHLSTDKKGGCGQATVNLAHPAGRARVGTGFMGMKWDGGDIAFRAELWGEALRVLKPGGYLLAFSGTRTYHRMVCAIEDGGFEIRDQIGWLYGSGFPKGTDKAKIPPEWQGWNTALKPAWEPICVARKPMAGTLAENLTEFGTGAMNIDGCRVALQPDESIDVTGCGAVPMRHHPEVPRQGRGAPERPAGLGRWPANVIHDGSEEVLDAFPEAPGQKADILIDPSQRKTQSVYNPMSRGREESAERRYADRGGTNFAMKPGARRLDTGSAARFFYCAKASRQDRNEGCEGLPERTSGMVSNTSGQHMTRRDGGAPGPSANYHPTVKPTDLCRYLLRLVTPPGGTSLDLFAGSGSFGKAAVLEGFDWIGFELDRDEDDKPVGYIAIAEARIAWAQRQVEEAARLAAEKAAQPATLDLFDSLEVAA